MKDASDWKTIMRAEHPPKGDCYWIRRIQADALHWALNNFLDHATEWKQIRDKIEELERHDH